MRKLIFSLICILSSTLGVGAAERVLHSYLFHGFKVLDRNNELVNEVPSSSGDPIGLFLVAEVDNEKYLSVSIGEDTAYEFKVVLSKEVEEDGTHAQIYAGGMQFEGQTVPMQVFVFSSGNPIPDCIVVDIFHSPTLIELNRLVKAGY